MPSQKPTISFILFVFLAFFFFWDCSEPDKPNREGTTTLQDGSIPTIPESKEGSTQDDGGLQDKESLLEDKDPANRDRTPQEPREATPNSEHKEFNSERLFPDSNHQIPESVQEQTSNLSSWVKHIERWHYSEGRDVAVDTQGNVYITGFFEKTAIFGSTTLTAPLRTDLPGYYDIFVAKLAPNGKWLWAKRAGGFGDDDRGYSIAVDAKGGIIITGQFDESADFGPFTLTRPKSLCGFIAKLNASGKWLWAERIESTELSSGDAVAIDSHNDILVTGHFYKTATFGKTTLTAKMLREIFVAKLDPNGKWLWAKSIGGPVRTRQPYNLATDAKDNVILIGSFYQSIQMGTIKLTAKANGDTFVAKLNSNGKWLWAKRSGGSPFAEHGSALAVDAQGNIFITGQFLGTSDFGATTFTSPKGGAGGAYQEIDIFVAKLDTNGKWLWAKRTYGTIKYPGGYNHYNEGRGITLDRSGNVYITGRFEEPTAFGHTTLKTSIDSDIFVAKLDGNGKWLWAKQAGSTKYNDWGSSIVVDMQGNIITTGQFGTPANFDGIKVTQTGSSHRAFVWKLRPKP